MTDRTEVPTAIIARLRAVCAALPESYEEQAWVGTRWCIRKHNFAHVVMIDDGWPPAYAAAAGTAGPTIVLTFRVSGEDLHALTAVGDPFFKPVWFPDIVGLVIDGDTDWDEVAELVTESFRILAPKTLVKLLDEAP